MRTFERHLGELHLNVGAKAAARPATKPEFIQPQPKRGFTSTACKTGKHRECHSLKCSCKRCDHGVS